jgi:sulfur carrier protein
VVVNGEERELQPGATVADLVAGLPGAPDGRGVAVAVDGLVVRRADWSNTAVAAGARIEVVVAVQGG